ncbi:MAG: dockerin type I repeat-containing protein [Clostridia bacterium]
MKKKTIAKVSAFVLTFTLLLNIVSVIAYAPVGYIKVKFGSEVIDVLIESTVKDYYLTAPKNSTSFEIYGVTINNTNLVAGNNVFNLKLDNYSFNLNIFVPTSSSIPVTSLKYTLNGTTREYSVSNFDPYSDNIYLDVISSTAILEFVEEVGVTIQNKKMVIANGILSQTITVSKGGISKDYTIHINAVVSLTFSNNLVIDVDLINGQTSYVIYAPLGATTFKLNDETPTYQIPYTLKSVYGSNITVKYPSPYDISNSIISKIPIDTKIDVFKNNLGDSDAIIITDSKGNVVTSGNIGTGMTVKINSGTPKTYTAIVTGDVSGDGKINIQDLQKCNNYILKIAELNGVYFTATDINGDNKINIQDLQKINNHILKISPINPR